MKGESRKSKAEVLEWLRHSKIVPVIRSSSAAEAMAACAQLIEGGIGVLEITMTVPGAIQLIRDAAERFGDSTLIGAGTVYNPATAEACVAAGAEFIVGPCTDFTTIAYCNSANVIVAAGALTPTEVVAAWRAGADVIKIFPCEALGGSAYIKSLKAPFPQIPLMPTGGVTRENINDYFEAGSVAVGLGSNLVKLDLIRQGRPKELAELARSYRLALRH